MSIIKAINDAIITRNDIIAKYCYLYHSAWAIAMVTFDVLREIYAHNMPVDREI